MPNKVTTCNDPALTYALLNRGDMFSFKGGIYMKSDYSLEGGYLAIRFNDGHVQTISHDEAVTRIYFAKVEPEKPW